ncbi:AAA family ATPase [Lentibacillus cibarius]|uniref:AAA family ATPase n=1 Tax=Lentibacillus cibarius TaxID=2583219 RepID=A0A5S3QGH0_9BACI|nr:AAA family ATPase [Lentibacillus cibarius]TMN20819.1 AAA family ATPase [Lentibacillus cibarius]
MDNLQKLQQMQQALNEKYMEREKQVEGMLIALLAKEHMLMVGPPGTAKSALSEELSTMIDGSTYFQWLLTKYTTPDEVFGGVMLKDMEEGIYKHNTDAKMPEAHLVFLDEIFKSSSEILNALLKAIHERTFENGHEQMAMPLMTLVGASNEYPEDDEGLEALFDRFLIRFDVDTIKDHSNFLNMLKGNEQPVTMPSMTLEELESLQFLREMVEIPHEIYEKIADIWVELGDEGIHPSDRRFRKAHAVLQAKALIEQRQIVEPEDLLFLQHVLWEHIDQRDTVATVIRRNAQDEVAMMQESIDREAQEIMQGLTDNDTTDYVLEANRKLKALMKEVQELQDRHPERQQALEAMEAKLKQHAEQLTDSILEPVQEPTL